MTVEKNPIKQFLTRRAIIVGGPALVDDATDEEVEMLMKAYTPAIYDVLGLFIPLIVVNCIVLGRAEAFAAKNSVGLSALDGIGMGLGFTLSLTVIGIIRELLGTGFCFGKSLIPEDYGMLLFVLAPGAFIVLGLLMGLFQKYVKK